MTFRNCVAVDLGASSGRVMLARYERECRSLTLREIHRFNNGLHSQNGYVTWDVDSLESAIRLGLNKVCEEGIRIDSIGIDTWGVDFVLLDQQGQRVGLPVAYRDSRTNGLMAQAQQQLGKRDIYQRSGIQFLPFNTLYQLRALTEQQPELIPHIAHALLMPDYFSYRLTGKMNWEYTNATTTQLVNINSDDWDESLLAWSGANKAWFGRPTHPGNVIGHWICPQGNEIPVVAVASHDTASAVIASPLNGSRAAYLSSGTWSLMGFESQTPFTNDTALAANITNEGGAEGRYRVLKNIMGLWLLQRVLQEQQINDLLALLYADVLHELAQLRGEDFSQLHIVGGGCQNTLLNQLCADACGIRVIAGPVEASTLGNIGIQLMTLDELNNVDDFRQVVSTTANLTTFTPNPDSEIAHYVAQIHSTRQTKELCA
ncbi:TPA: rhamnulokinase [Escherichia coli]|nr:rhamnulokinase [Escherichia coli]HAM4354729.1 rhamnulokinase [Escherichia coli]